MKFYKEGLTLPSLENRPEYNSGTVLYDNLSSSGKLDMVTTAISESGCTVGGSIGATLWYKRTGTGPNGWWEYIILYYSDYSGSWSTGFDSMNQQQNSNQMDRQANKLTGDDCLWIALVRACLLFCLLGKRR